MRPHLAFNLGRVVGFGALGAVIGGAGQALAISGTALAVLMLVVALVMALLGLRLTQVSPRIAGWQAALPSSWGRWARTPTADAPAQSASTRDLRAMGLGVATFFLPCGFTQAVQVLALGSGSAVSGAAIMSVFALATAPGLLAAGAAATLARREGTARALRFAGVVVLGFAVVTGAGAVTSLAPGLVTRDVAATERTTNVTDQDGVQVVNTIIWGDGYEPAHSVVYVGEPVQWELEPHATSCAGLLDVRSLGLGSIEALFEDVTVEFTLDKPGTYAFACSMGMYTGSFTAIERPEPA
jgi:sulfite exporter TauE/SafE